MCCFKLLVNDCTVLVPNTVDGRVRVTYLFPHVNVFLLIYWQLLHSVLLPLSDI